MTRFPYLGLAFAALLAACGGGGGDDDDGTGDGGPPTQAEMVAQGGFRSPTFAAMSPDGETAYFAALTDEAEPHAAIFSMPAQGGDLTAMTSDARLELVAGLGITDDGSTLVVGEGLPRAEFDQEGQSSLYTLSTSGGDLLPLAAEGVASVSGLVVLGDLVYLTGTTDDGDQALFTLPIGGGAAHVVLAGAPLVEPNGLDVDEQGVAWVMHNDPSRALGSALLSIEPDGTVSEVVSGLGLADDCHRFKGGNIAVIPRTTDDGVELLTKDLVTGDETTIATDMKLPAGVGGAREAARIVVTDNEKNAIYLVH